MRKQSKGSWGKFSKVKIPWGTFEKKETLRETIGKLLPKSREIHRRGQLSKKLPQSHN